MLNMIDKAVSSFHELYSSVQAHLYFLWIIFLVLWGVQFCNAACNYRLNRLGILPRKPAHLLGIFISPFLHGSYSHLFLNSIPLFVLAALVLVGGEILFLKISFLIIAVSGFVVWLLGRPGYHVGASALVLGYWGFLLCNAYIQRSFMALFLALLCLYYFGHLIYSLFPQEEGVSWEGHIAGFFTGIFVSLFVTHLGW